MKYTIILLGCSKSDNTTSNKKKYLYFVASDGFYGVLAKASIDPPENFSTVMNTGGQNQLDITADFTNNKFYLATGFEAAIDVYNPDNFSDIKRL